MKTRSLILVLALAVVFAQAGNAQNPGNTLQVPEQYSRIQDALNAASPGDEVRVAPGTYSPSANNEVFPLNLTDGVTLIGRSPETTILDAEGTGRVINAFNLEDERSRIDGFTIRGGNVENAPAEENGGGGIFSDNSALVISNNVITANAAIHGGGILARGQRAPVIAGNHIEENTVPFAGFGAAVLVDSCRAELVNNIIARNSSGRGTVTIINAAPLVVNNTLVGSTEGSAYAVGIHVTANGDPVLANNIISNFKDYAILEEDTESDPVIRHNLFDANGDDYLDEGKDAISGPALEARVNNEENEVQGNVFGPAGFVDPTLGDFRLASNSAAIDAGDNGVLGLPPVDLAGTERVLGQVANAGVVDIGAYEFIPPNIQTDGSIARSTTTYEVVEEPVTTTTYYTEEPVTTRYYYYDGPRYVYRHYYVDYPLYTYSYTWWPDYYYTSVWWPHRSWCYYPYFYYDRHDNHHRRHHHDGRDDDWHRGDRDGRDGRDGRDDRDHGGRDDWDRDNGGRDGRDGRDSASGGGNPRTGPPLAPGLAAAGERSDSVKAVADRSARGGSSTAATPGLRTDLGRSMNTERNASTPAVETRSDDTRGTATDVRRGSPSLQERTTPSVPTRNEVVTTAPRVDTSRASQERRGSSNVVTVPSTPVESRVSRSYPAPVSRGSSTVIGAEPRSGSTAGAPSRNEVVTSSPRRESPTFSSERRSITAPSVPERTAPSAPVYTPPVRRESTTPVTTVRRSSSSVESTAPRAITQQPAPRRESYTPPVTVAPRQSAPAPVIMEPRRSSAPVAVPRTESFSRPPEVPRETRSFSAPPPSRAPEVRSSGGSSSSGGGSDRGSIGVGAGRRGR